ncbi:hypothetical protein [Marilutibacter chinensis]|uniref:Uncharacterized protein n=1 Tax=Marilutibacter chinensis TaxID=2912247 RepID=A0ABS9HQG7_9GAMM|nr:hypothetical protein [Lysobacter chinensis]MCF7221185.1 hypothetical protein [Lysobacter chinensis]MCF7223074.1 hypothetical protein [Lysobacter chinensis]
MTNTPLHGLVIRDAIVRIPGTGYIYAADPAREADGVPHAITFKYQQGRFIRGDANYDAFALALVSHPEPGLVSVAGAGYYSAISASGSVSGDLFDNSNPLPPVPRTGGIRAVASIGGRAFAVGLRGMAYRLDQPRQWTRIDDGLPADFDVLAIDGGSDADLHAVGRGGGIWHFDDRGWQVCESPTSAALRTIHCTDAGDAYAAGDGGVLLQRRNGVWETIEHGCTRDTIWSLAGFQGQLYAATLSTLYRIEGNGLVEVDFGNDRPASCRRISVCDGQMWSAGDFDLMAFDGERWSRIV